MEWKQKNINTLLKTQKNCRCQWIRFVFRATQRITPSKRKGKIMVMYNAQHLSPMIPSFNIEETVSFFTNLLDFKIGRHDKTYVVLYKDNAMVHILRAGEDIGEMEFYLEVDNIEKVWDKMKDTLNGMKVKGPFDREYGMREVHVIIPETKTLMFIGQAIKS